MTYRIKQYSNSSVTLQVEQYQQDLKIIFKDRAIPGRSSGGRGAIVAFSFQAQRRFTFFIRNVVHHFRYLVHLTYPSEFPIDLRVSQTHLNTFLQYLRRKGARYVWVKEFQKRGAVHFHIVTDVWIPKKILSQRWFEIVGTGDPKHLEAGTRIEKIKSRDHAAAYMCGYLKKSTQKVVPEEVSNVGRFWGSTRGLLVAKSTVILKKVRIRDIKKVYRIIGKAYKAKLKAWGIKGWHWKERGFIGWSMSSIYERIAPQIKFKEVVEYASRG